MMQKIIPVTKILMICAAISFAGYASVYFDFGRHVLGKPAAIFTNPAWKACFYTHISMGIVAIVTGSFQFLHQLRQKWPLLHKRLGRLYVSAVVISGAVSLYTSCLANGGLAGRVGFLMIAFCWIGTTFLAYRTALQKDFARHRRWMIRSYAVTLSSISLRIWLSVLTFGFGIEFFTSYILSIWLALIINLLCAEWMTRKIFV